MGLNKFRSVNLRIDKADDYFISNQFAKDGDFNGRKLVVQLTNGGLIEDQTGVALNLGWQHQKVKNKGLDPFTVVDATQGVFEIYYPAEMMQTGNVVAVIQVIESGKIVETRNFTIQVEASPIDEGAIVSENSFTVLQKALITVNQYDGRIATLESNKANKTDVAASFSEVNAQLAHKANEDKVNQSLELKRDKSVPIGQNDIDSGLANAISGGTTISVESIPRDYSVTPIKTDFFITSRNLFDKASLSEGRINETNGELILSDSYYVTQYIKIKPETEYQFSRGYKYAFYDNNKNYISGGNALGTDNATVQSLANATYIRFEVHKTAFNLDYYMFSEGVIPPTYEDFGVAYIPLDKLENPKDLSRDNFNSVFMLGNDLPRETNLNLVKSEGNYTGVANGNYANLPNGFDVAMSFLIENKALFKGGNRWFLQTVTENGGEYRSWLRRVDATGAGTTSWVNPKSSGGSPLEGKNIAFFGDSITEFGNYPDVAVERVGGVLHKFGFGGTRLANHTDHYYDAFCFAKLVDAIISRDFTLQQSKVDDTSNPFSARFKLAFEQLKNTDFTKIDHVLIYYGTNDYMGTVKGSVPIGNPTDTTRETFYGGLNYATEKISSAYPNLKIAFIAPTWRVNHADLGGGEVDTTPNQNGTFLVEFVDAIIKTATKNHLPYLDLFRTGGINKYNKTLYLSDTVHYTTLGYDSIGNKIGSFLISTY